MFTLIKRAIAAIPTPSAGKVTVFVDSSSGQPYMKDETGTATTLVGTTGATGPAGATGPDGTDSGIFWMGGSQGPRGADGLAGAPGATGATGATGPAGAGSDETLGWMDSKQQTPPSAPDIVFFKYTLGNLSLNSIGAWADLPVSGALDMVLRARVGDVVEVGISGTTSNAAPYSFLDVASIVSGSPVNYWACAGGASDEGVQAWRGIANVFTPVGGSVMKTIVPGDLSSGKVTLRFRYATNLSGTKVLNASSTDPFQCWAKNLTAH